MVDSNEIDEAIRLMKIQYIGQENSNSMFIPIFKAYLCESLEVRSLRELANLCQEYLRDSDGNGHWLDSSCMSAGERAFMALEKHGLIRTEGKGLRIARWTDAGRNLLDNT